jgi:tetratricopeptide (TPR) repeat protein
MTGSWLIHRCVRKKEENTDQCFRLATNCQRSGNGTGAIFWFRKCLTLSPEVAKYHVALATSLATLSQFRREAVEHLQRAIEPDQWDPLAYLRLGKLYEEMQLPWRAGPLYSKVLEMDPGHSVARQRLAAIDDQANRKQGWRWRPYSARSVKQSLRMMKCLSKFHAAVDNC